MIVPIICFVLSLVVIGFLHTLLDPVVTSMIAASAVSDPVVALYHFVWDYFGIIFFIAGTILLVLLAQKRRGGGVYG